MYTGTLRRYAVAAFSAAAVTLASSAFADGHDDAAIYESDETIYIPPESAVPQTSLRPLLRPEFEKPIPKTPEWISDATYIVINPETNKVLVEKGADDRQEPASLTKLLTGAVMFEAIKQNPDKFDLNDKMEIPQWAFDTIKNHPLGIAYSRSLKPDTPYKIGDILIGMGARSDGISTLGLMLYFSDNYLELEGTESQKNVAFVEEMNKLAQKIGMTNSEFNVTTGIRSSGTNESTPEDFARLMRYMNAEHPELMEHTFGTAEFDLPHVTGWKVPTSRLFQRRSERVENAKTGMTNKGYTFTLTYEKSGTDTSLVAVIMNVHPPKDVVGWRKRDGIARERRSQLALDILSIGYERLETEGVDAGRPMDEDIVTAILTSPRPIARTFNPLQRIRPPQRPPNLAAAPPATKNGSDVDLAFENP